VLQTPAFVNTLRQDGLADSGEVGSMVHANLDSVCTEITDERREETGTRRVWCFSRSTQSIGCNGNLEIRVRLECIVDGGNLIASQYVLIDLGNSVNRTHQLMFTLADVEG
jgi:hypothetical protein